MSRTNKTIFLFMVCISLIFIQLMVLSLSGWAFDFSKKLLYEGSYSLESQKLNNCLTFKIDYVHEISDDLFFQGDLIIRTSNRDYSKPFIIGPNELYFTAYDVLENLDLKIGQIITRWGAADLFSPLDNFNPAPPELSLAANQGKIGALGINTTYYINSVTYLQAVLLPWLEPTPFPDQYLMDSYLNQFGPLYQMQGIDIDRVELSYQSTKNPIWGIQLNHSFPSFDMGISYYRGYYMDPFPSGIDLSLNTSGNVMKVSLGYPAKQVLGLEFEGDFPGIDGATLRGDLAYIIPERWDFQGEKILEKPYLQAIISADYMTDSNLYLNGGFIYGLPFERGDQCSPYLYLAARKEITNSDFLPFYTGVISLKDLSMANTIGLEYQINDNIKTTLSYMFVLGDYDSRLGMLKPSQGFSFSLEWLF